MYIIALGKKKFKQIKIIMNEKPKRTHNVSPEGRKRMGHHGPKDPSTIEKMKSAHLTRWKKIKELEARVKELEDEMKDAESIN